MKTIAWDIDDVLNNFMRYWFESEWLPNHKNCSLKYEDITKNPPYKLLGVSKDVYLKSLDNFRILKKAKEMKPVNEVIVWFNKFGKYFRHIAITERPINSIPEIAHWLFNYFGRWIRTFHFIPSPRSNENIIRYESNKSNYFVWLGKVDIFVDDNNENVNNAKDLGINGILIPRPWNNCNLTIKEALNLIKK